MESIVNLRSVLFLLSVAALSGCATTRPLDTPSGKPQIFIPNTTMSNVQNVILDVLMQEGMTIDKQTPNMLVMDKPDHSLSDSILIGTQYNPTPDYRLVFQFAQMGTGCEVFATVEYVANPASQFEQITPAPSANQKAQHMLENLKAAIAREHDQQP